MAPVSRDTHRHTLMRNHNKTWKDVYPNKWKDAQKISKAKQGSQSINKLTHIKHATRNPPLFSIPTKGEDVSRDCIIRVYMLCCNVEQMTTLRRSNMSSHKNEHGKDHKVRVWYHCCLNCELITYLDSWLQCAPRVLQPRVAKVLERKKTECIWLDLIGRQITVSSNGVNVWNLKSVVTHTLNCSLIASAAGDVLLRMKEAKRAIGGSTWHFFDNKHLHGYRWNAKEIACFSCPAVTVMEKTLGCGRRPLLCSTP